MKPTSREAAVIAGIRRLVYEAMQETAAGDIGIKTLAGLPIAVGMLDSFACLFKDGAVINRDPVQ